MYQERRNWSYVKNACASAPDGGTAAVTNFDQRSGSYAAAPVAMSAPQSWPISTADPSPSSASCSATASATAAPFWYRPCGSRSVGA